MSHRDRELMLELMSLPLPTIRLSLHSLRLNLGHQRLGSRVVEDISRELHERGKRHLPARIPRDQSRHILIWTAGQPGTEILDLTLRLDAAAAGSELTDADLELLEATIRLAERAAMEEEEEAA